MTNHKLRWIVYMLNIIKPANGLHQACREMLSERYDNAFAEGQRQLADLLDEHSQVRPK